MSNSIYTYGGGEALFQVLNGVAMIFNHPVTTDLLKLTTLMGISWAAYQGILQNSVLPKLSWVIKYSLVTALFIVPKGTLYIHDSVYKTVPQKIDNLPIGLILPASFFSNIGYGMTKLFDQAFADVGSLEYTKYGQSFGAALISQARNFKIQDASFRENMEGFIDGCVLNDVMYGYKYTASELRDSTNIWELVSSNASNIKMFNYRDGKNGRSLVTCKAGAKLISDYWRTDIDKLAGKFSKTIFGKYGGAKKSNSNDANSNDLGKMFINNVKVASSIYKKDSNASQTLKQLMMINAMNDIPMSYGAVRAKQQQQESWMITGQIARESLPLLHSVFAALIYASFTLIVGMLVLPSGMKILGNYIGLLLWIETWPPLFAVINLISNLSGKMYGGDFTKITMNDASQIISHNNQIGVVASGLMIVLPYLSYNIIKGGAGSFVHLAGQILGSSQGAASAAASEVVSGNRSLDNKTMSTGQWFNNNGFKTDMNSSLRVGHQEYQQSDGSIVKTAASGEQIFQSGPGLTTSTGSKTMHLSDNISSGHHESLNFEKSVMDSKQKEYSTTEQSAKRQAVDLVSRIASGEASGEHYNYGDTTSSGKTFTKLIENTKELHDRHGYTYTQAAEASINGDASVKTTVGTSGAKGGAAAGPVESLNPLSGIIHPNADTSVNVGVTGKLSSVNQNNQEINEQKGASSRKTVNENLEHVAKAASEIQYNTNQSNEKSLSDSLTGSFEKMKSLRDQITVSEQNIDRYQRTDDTSIVKSFNTSDDLYGKELNYIASQPAKHNPNRPMGGYAARELMEKKGGPEYEHHHKNFMNQQLGQLQKMSSNNFNYQDKVDALIPQTIANTDINDIKNVAEKKTKLEPVNQNAKSNVDFYQPIIKEQTESEKPKILEEGNDLQKKVDKEEINRGFFSRIIFGKKDTGEKFGD